MEDAADQAETVLPDDAPPGSRAANRVNQELLEFIAESLADRWLKSLGSRSSTTADEHPVASPKPENNSA